MQLIQYIYFSLIYRACVSCDVLRVLFTSKQFDENVWSALFDLARDDVQRAIVEKHKVDHCPYCASIMQDKECRMCGYQGAKIVNITKK
jgi:hypothetical protein